MIKSHVVSSTRLGGRGIVPFRGISIILVVEKRRNFHLHTETNKRIWKFDWLNIKSQMS